MTNDHILLSSNDHSSFPSRIYRIDKKLSPSFEVKTTL